MEIARDLPLLNAATTPAQALRAMRAASRSAVVRDDGVTTSLVMGGAIAAAWKTGATSIGEIGPREPVATVTDQDTVQYSLDVDNPFNTVTEFEKFFQSVVPNYALTMQATVRSTGSLVSIVTASESMLPSLIMLGAYICNGPSRHTFPDPTVRDAQPCPLCPSATRATVTLIVP